MLIPQMESSRASVLVYFVCVCIFPALALHQEVVAKEPEVLFLLFQFSIVQFSFIAPVEKFALLQ